MKLLKRRNFERYLVLENTWKSKMRGKVQMNKNSSYKNVKSFFLGVVSLCALISGQAAMAQKYGVIYYDYIDEQGVLKGGIIAVDPTNPHHTVVKGRGPVVLQNGWDVETIINNGPTGNRVDLAILGDGYTEGELGVYAIDAANFMAGFFSELPLDEYASFFNVHRVDVVSNESGVDHDPVFPIWRDTELDMGFWCDGMERLLCVDVEKAQTAMKLPPRLLSFLTHVMITYMR